MPPELSSDEMPDIDADSIVLSEHAFTPESALNYAEQAHGPGVRLYIENRLKNINDNSVITADTVLDLIPEARGCVKKAHFQSGNIGPLTGDSIDD